MLRSRLWLSSHTYAVQGQYKGRIDVLRAIRRGSKLLDVCLLPPLPRKPQRARMWSGFKESETETDLES